MRIKPLRKNGIFCLLAGPPLPSLLPKIAQCGVYPASQHIPRVCTQSHTVYSKSAPSLIAHSQRMHQVSQRTQRMHQVSQHIPGEGTKSHGLHQERAPCVKRIPKKCTQSHSAYQESASSLTAHSQRMHQVLQHFPREGAESHKTYAKG